MHTTIAKPTAGPAITARSVGTNSRPPVGTHLVEKERESGGEHGRRDPVAGSELSVRHRRAEDQRDDDGERKDRLDEDDGRQCQCAGLGDIAEHVAQETEEPPWAADQPGHETDAQGVLVGNLLRFGQLEHVAQRVQEGRQEGQDDRERDFDRHGASVWPRVKAPA